MKLFILGLDGLDCGITLKLKLKNLLQKQFGKIDVPIDEKFGFPISPEVWASFLCAENVEMDFKGRRNLWALNLLHSLKKMFPGCARALLN